MKQSTHSFDDQIVILALLSATSLFKMPVKSPDVYL